MSMTLYVGLANEQAMLGSGKEVDCVCKICGKVNKDWTKAKLHLVESIHFPTMGAYSCSRCGMAKNTKSALNSHEFKCSA